MTNNELAAVITLRLKRKYGYYFDKEDREFIKKMVEKLTPISRGLRV